MSYKVKVFNKNVHPLKEIFKGNEVFIAAQDYWRDEKGKVKVMDVYEANDYRGQYAPVPFDGSGKMIDDPRHFKMIELQRTDSDRETDETEDKTSIHKCMAPSCKHVSPSSEELSAHVKVRHPGVETLVLPEEDREIAKRGRGRPKKDVDHEDMTA